MTPIVTRERFSDFGQYREQLRCWDTEAVQLTPGRLSLAFDCFDTGSVVLSRLQFDQDAVVRAARKPGWHAFFTHVQPKRWCGVDLPAGAIVSMRPGRETNTVSHSRWSSITILVKDDTLASWPSPLGGLVDRDVAPARSFIPTAPDAIERFRAWLQLLFCTPVPTDSEEDTATYIDAIRERLQQYMLEVLGHRYPAGPVSSAHRVARYDLALAALRLIHRETSDRITVGSLARELGVGVRSLEHAFRHVVGVSPARYILADRLNRVRHRLMAATKTTETVTNAAFDHQFDNLSRFAMQYARLFDERPSDTLRGARRSFHAAR